MTREEIRDAIAAELHRIAPEVDPGEIDPSADLREEVDIDSMDFLNLVIAVGEKLGIEIPESDYARLQTLNAFVEYLLQREGIR